MPVKFYLLKDAHDKKLVPVTGWLRDNQKECEHVERLQMELEAKGRTTMAVKHNRSDGCKVALFANDILSHSTYIQKPLPLGRCKSKSGKFKNIRHLCECAFADNQDMTYEQFKALLRKEFPKCAAVRNGSYHNHYKQYRHIIVIQWQFQYIEKPKWAR